jgi:hypothetical protein
MLFDSTIQERIDATIVEAVKNAPPTLSVEEQREKNQAAIDMLHKWDEEDETDDPEELARREAEWQEFKRGMNENSLSGRIIYPAQDYP